MLTITISQFGIPQFRASLINMGNIGKRGEFKPLWKDIIKSIAYGERKIFSKEGEIGDDWRRWQPLTDKYARWKHKHFPGKKILVLHGILKRAATIPGAHGNKIKEDNYSVIYGVDTNIIKYARVHQFGGVYMWSRPYMHLWNGKGSPIYAIERKIHAFIRQQMLYELQLNGITARDENGNKINIQKEYKRLIQSQGLNETI